MSLKDNRMIEDLREVAKEVLPQGSHVWLYGSRARGDYHEESDWDLLILIDKPHVDSKDEDEYSFPFVMKGWHNAAAVSPLLYTFSEWQERKHSPFYENVERDKFLIS